MKRPSKVDLFMWRLRDGRPRKWCCETCKQWFTSSPTYVEACIFNGDKGRPPFREAHPHKSPELKYLSENKPILALIVYCPNCI